MHSIYRTCTPYCPPEGWPWQAIVITDSRAARNRNTAPASRRRADAPNSLPSPSSSPSQEVPTASSQDLQSSKTLFYMHAMTANLLVLSLLYLNGQLGRLGSGCAGQIACEGGPVAVLRHFDTINDLTPAFTDPPSPPCSPAHPCLVVPCQCVRATDTTVPYCAGSATP